MVAKRELFDIDTTGFPREISTLLRDLGHEHGHERIQAHEQLVEMGKDILVYLEPLLGSKNRVLRWEAAKIMEEIADMSSMKILLDLLEDNDRDIRWIAAEGLVELGRDIIIPLLERLEEEGRSRYLDEGAHHVFTKMFRGSDREFIKSLMDVLKSKHMGDLVSYEALQLLHKLRNKH